MQIITYAFCILLLLKIMYNLTIPYVLLRKHSTKEGISFIPWIELLFLLLAVISALFVDNTNALLNAGKLALIGAGLVVASYLHLFVVMMIGGWLLSKRGAED